MAQPPSAVAFSETTSLQNFCLAATKICDPLPISEAHPLVIRDEPVYGTPLTVSPLTYEPTHEGGVIFLFARDGHAVTGCDVIVCWNNNGEDCPMEVMELKSVLNGWKEKIGIKACFPSHSQHRLT